MKTRIKRFDEAIEKMDRSLIKAGEMDTFRAYLYSVDTGKTLIDFDYSGKTYSREELKAIRNTLKKEGIKGVTLSAKSGALEALGDFLAVGFKFNGMTEVIDSAVCKTYTPAVSLLVD